MSALINFSSVCLALGAGLVASARTRVWTRALAGAAALAFILMAGLFLALVWIVMAYWTVSFGSPFPQWRDFSQSPQAGLAMVLNIKSVCQSWLFRRGPGVLLCSYAILAAVSGIALCVLSRFAALNLNRTWQEKPPSSGSVWLRERLFKPMLFRKQLRGWLRWQLERNPIGWLEQRSWSGRLVVWSWFAIVLCVYSSLFSNLALYERAFHYLQSVLATLLAGSMAVSAAGSFRRERETGVLELLLVAPLREWQVILGRVKGLWAQFLPAIVLLCAVWLYGATFLSNTNELPSVIGFLVTFATIPVVGLYFSLAKSNFIAALVWTILVQVVLPSAALMLDLQHLQGGPGEVVIRAAVQCGVAGFLAWRLLLLLERREFVKTAV